MKLFELTEARRHPHLNPKLSEWEQIQAIVQKHGADNVYIRSTNPVETRPDQYQKQDTRHARFLPPPNAKWIPKGTYCFPIEQMLNTRGRQYWFGQNMPHVWLFKGPPLNPTQRWDMTSTLDKQLQQRCFQACQQILGEVPPRLQRATSNSQLFYILKRECGLDQHKKDVLTPILKHMGIVVLRDVEGAAVIGRQPYECVFLLNAKLQVLDFIQDFKALGNNYQAARRKHLRRPFYDDLYNRQSDTDLRIDISTLFNIKPGSISNPMQLLRMLEKLDPDKIQHEIEKVPSFYKPHMKRHNPSVEDAAYDLTWGILYDPGDKGTQYIKPIDANVLSPTFPTFNDASAAEFVQRHADDIDKWLDKQEDAHKWVRALLSDSFITQTGITELIKAITEYNLR